MHDLFWLWFIGIPLLVKRELNRSVESLNLKRGGLSNYFMLFKSVVLLDLLSRILAETSHVTPGYYCAVLPITGQHFLLCRPLLLSRVFSLASQENSPACYSLVIELSPFVWSTWLSLWRVTASTCATGRTDAQRVCRLHFRFHFEDVFREKALFVVAHLKIYGIQSIQCLHTEHLVK